MGDQKDLTATSSPGAAGTHAGPQGGTTGHDPKAPAGATGPNYPGGSHPTAPPPTHTPAGAPMSAAKPHEKPEPGTKKLSEVEEANARTFGVASPPPVADQNFPESAGIPAPQQTTTHTKKY